LALGFPVFLTFFIPAYDQLNLEPDFPYYDSRIDYLFWSITLRNSRNWFCL